jgi:hypothetical protein
MRCVIAAQVLKDFVVFAMCSRAEGEISGEMLQRDSYCWLGGSRGSAVHNGR